MLLLINANMSPLTPSTLSSEDQTTARVRAASAALQNFDYPRIASDKAYAEAMLRHSDVLMSLAAADPSASAAVAGLRAVILAALGRADESKFAIQAVIASKVPDEEPYVLAWGAAADIAETDLMVDVIEAVARQAKSTGRTAALEAFAPEIVWPLYQHYRGNKQEAQRFRLVEALVELNWPGGTDSESREGLRMDLIDRRLAQGDRSAAARLAQTITAPQAFLQLILLRKYDDLLPSTAVDRLAPLLADYDRQTSEGLASRPPDHRAVLLRAKFLRGQGHEAKAASLLAPFMKDVPKTHADSEVGMWLINEAAYALQALGRHDEALASMSQLVKLDMDASPDLIGPSINYADMLRRAERPRESLAHLEQLASQEKYASQYGRMWILSTTACSLADAGEREEALQRLRAMEKQRQINPVALMRAMLCLNELEAAEQLAIERLKSDEPTHMVLAFQDYQRGGADSGPAKVISDRLLKLRERPAVAAALDKVGRRMTLPLSRTYYGDV